jgi:hypothetical protein
MSELDETKGPFLREVLEQRGMNDDCGAVSAAAGSLRGGTFDSKYVCHSHVTRPHEVNFLGTSE